MASYWVSLLVAAFLFSGSASAGRCSLKVYRILHWPLTEEHEFKIAISRKDLPKLKEALGAPLTRYEYTSYYFDNPKSQLWVNRFSLRLRLYDDRNATITLKFPMNAHLLSDVPLKSRWEIEDAVHFHSALRIIDGKDEITSLSNTRAIQTLSANVSKKLLKSLEQIGRVSTIRQEYEVDGTTIQLDEFSVKGCWSAELEIEVKTGNPWPVIQKVTQLLKDLGIDWTPSVDSKRSKLR